MFLILIFMFPDYVHIHLTTHAMYKLYMRNRDSVLHKQAKEKRNKMGRRLQH